MWCEQVKIVSPQAETPPNFLAAVFSTFLSSSSVDLYTIGCLKGARVRMVSGCMDRHSLQATAIHRHRSHYDGTALSLVSLAVIHVFIYLDCSEASARAVETVGAVL